MPESFDPLSCDPRSFEAPTVPPLDIPAAEATTFDQPAAPPTRVTVGLPGRVADFEPLEEIARGGMGVVYRARQISLNRIVALKMILAGQFASESAVRRFH